MANRVILWDIDGTLLPTSLERQFLRRLRNQGYVSLPRIIAQALRLSLTLPPPRWYNLKLCYLRGFSIETVNDLAGDCWREAVRPLLHSHLVALIGEFHHKGIMQVLLSGTPRFLAEPLADFLAIEHLIAAEPELRHGRLTGGLSCPHPYGKQKVTAAASWLAEHDLHWEQALAIADSWVDRFLLRQVGRAVVIDPGYCLRREAQRRGWIEISSDSDSKEILRLTEAGG